MLVSVTTIFLIQGYKTLLFRLQGLQRDIEKLRRALLALQGSLADSAEENAGLRRELEVERVKVAASSRQLENSSERHESALEEVRNDSMALRRQRDR